MERDYGKLAPNRPDKEGKFVLVWRTHSTDLKHYWTESNTWSLRRSEAKVFKRRRTANMRLKQAAFLGKVKWAKITVEEV